MTDQQSQDPANKTLQGKERKKLQKREQKLQECLEDARAAQSAALERFRRAEVRLQKRIVRVDKLEKRLQDVEVQLHGETLAKAIEASAPVILPLRILNMEELAQQPDPHVEAANVNGAETEEVAISSTEMARLALDARAVVHAAEQSARLAAERARSVTAQLEPLFSTSEIETLSEEEELVSALASLMIAETTATAAAHAEAVAEEKSVQAEQARRRMNLADQKLRKVRAAITNRDLVGEEAEAALQDAESEFMLAGQALALAEEAEEQARRTARM